MIVLFTDFGAGGPYVGQMKAVLHRLAPGVDIIELLADAPAYDVEAAAYLLAAYAAGFPPATVFLCVVDPGVGTVRRAAAIEADGRWYVAPDNGLLNVVATRAGRLYWWDITWRPQRLSASFHRRDLFAPVAARLAQGGAVPSERADTTERLRPGWPDDLARIVYVDHFGNAITGMRASELDDDRVIAAAGRRLGRARTFADTPQGEAFWYENANGLAEIAVNGGRAADVLGLSVGTAVRVI